MLYKNIIYIKRFVCSTNIANDRIKKGFQLTNRFVVKGCYNGVARHSGRFVSLIVKANISKKQQV